ncbi:hypothetical protein SETIT_2G174600v2 [Setaria italica]|uniref:Core domain-containing protein n=1 Tax=Setaria italica TaxID=4555 RepID=K4A0Q4_SETIT|nr:iron-sulfur assembly protein IscA-like 2, mitochondrial isoform X1 [Setaria italica]RCV11295.1 hypothetical protein SETIT_2G174600v2 [Setaria italica]
MASAGPPLLRRIAPLLNGRIRANHRLLAFSSVVTAAAETTSSAEPEAVVMTENRIRRLKELHAKEPCNKGKMLRLCVEAGGCSGFQYAFLPDDKTNADDRVFEKDGAKLVVDNVSYEFVKGATVDYVEELIRAAFLVSANPSAIGGCSCKSSFNVK